MKSKKTVLADYNREGRPLTENPKRLTKRMRKKFFGKGASGKPGRGRHMIRKEQRIFRSAKYKAKQKAK